MQFQLHQQQAELVYSLTRFCPMYLRLSVGLGKDVLSNSGILIFGKDRSSLTTNRGLSDEIRRPTAFASW